MRSTTRRRWYAATIGAVVVGGVLAGGVVGAAFQDPAPEGLDEALATQPLVKVADVPAAPGVAGRSVFMQAAAGLLCVWESPSAGPVAKDGGCNPLDDPLAGRKMMISFGYEGGPSIRGVRDARLVGIASLDVADIQVVMTDGSRRAVSTRRTPKLAGAAETFRAFGYRLKTSDLKRGVGPTAVVAFDAAGREIDRQATGFVE